MEVGVRRKEREKDERTDKSFWLFLSSKVPACLHRYKKPQNIILERLLALVITLIYVLHDVHKDVLFIKYSALCREHGLKFSEF